MLLHHTHCSGCAASFPGRRIPHVWPAWELHRLPRPRLCRTGMQTSTWAGLHLASQPRSPLACCCSHRSLALHMQLLGVADRLHLGHLRHLGHLWPCSSCLHSIGQGSAAAPRYPAHETGWAAAWLSCAAALSAMLSWVGHRTMTGASREILCPGGTPVWGRTPAAGDWAQRRQAQSAEAGGTLAWATLLAAAAVAAAVAAAADGHSWQHGWERAPLQIPQMASAAIDSMLAGQSLSGDARCNHVCRAHAMQVKAAAAALVDASRRRAAKQQGQVWVGCWSGRCHLPWTSVQAHTAA